MTPALAALLLEISSQYNRRQAAYREAAQDVTTADMPGDLTCYLPNALIREVFISLSTEESKALTVAEEK